MRPSSHDVETERWGVALHGFEPPMWRAPRERRVAIVTGSSGGLGKAIATSLAEAGFHLTLHYHRNATAAEALAEALRNGIETTTFQADLTRSVDADALVAHTICELGSVDVLVNNAGLKADAPLHKLCDEDWDAVLRTNLTATMYTTRAALPGVYERGWGRILNLASIGAQAGYVGTAAYAASKAGIIGLTKVVAAEGARRGVTCNAIAPGLMGAGMGADLPLPRQAFDAMLAATPAGRPGAAQEVGGLCAFLASPAASYITGQVYSTTVAAVSNLSFGSGVIVIFLFTGSPDRVSALSSRATRARIRPVIQDGGRRGQPSCPGFPSPFGCRHSLLGHPIPAEELGPPHGRLTGPEARTSTGLPRFARTSYNRGGCLLYPEDGGALSG